MHDASVVSPLLFSYFVWELELLAFSFDIYVFIHCKYTISGPELDEFRNKKYVLCE